MEHIDFDRHNAEVKEVWDAFNAGRPIRVPIVVGTNPRIVIFNEETNPGRVTFRDYIADPDLMMRYQLIHQDWVRHNIPQDAEMGLPSEGWNLHVDFQNFYEAAWLGCEVVYYDDQVPDTRPLLTDDRKNLLFDRGIPDPFGGWMAKNREYYEYFKSKVEEGYEYKGRPVISATPCALGTDGPFTVACSLRGAPEMCMDLLLDPDYAHRLLDFITEAAIVRIKAWKSYLGQEPVTQSWGFADDSIALLSTEMYKEHILPYHRRLVETFSKGGPNSIHLCGDASRHFKTLQEELNIQSFDTGYPIDHGWVRRTLGPGVHISGGPNVGLLKFGSPSDVERETARILQSGIMEGGKFVLREGNNLPPGVPLENLWAMYKAGKKYGVYP